MAEPKRKTSRHLKAEATKRSIAESALRLFSEHGVMGTSTRQIAEQAGVSEGLIFHHFPDKAALLRAVAATRTSFGTEVVAMLAEADGRPLSNVLDNIAELFCTMVVAGTPEAQLFSVLLGESRSNPELYELFRSVVGRVTSALSGYLRSRVHAGELCTDLDLDTVAHTTLGGLILFFTTHSHLTKRQWNRQAPLFVDNHMRMIQAALHTASSTTE